MLWLFSLCRKCLVTYREAPDQIDGSSLEREDRTMIELLSWRGDDDPHEKPSELPLQAPIKLKRAIQLGTAKAPGIALAPLRGAAARVE
jgi:hypothetical protein